MSKFYGLGDLCHKKSLAQVLNRMKELFPEEYSFHPSCWLLPEEYEQFYLHTQEHSKPNKFYIVKPDAGSQGKNCIILKNRYLFNHDRFKPGVRCYYDPSLHTWIPLLLLTPTYWFVLQFDFTYLLVIW